MTNATVGLALVYVFEDGEEMLVRIGELFGPLGKTLEYMESKHGKIVCTIEPSLARQPYGKIQGARNVEVSSAAS